MRACNEYGHLSAVAVRSPAEAFEDSGKIAQQWQALRFNRAPDMAEAGREHERFSEILLSAGATVHTLQAGDGLTLDAIYVRDAAIVTPGGLILCRMGRESRRAEPALNGAALEALGERLLGVIEPPGMLEGGDFIWINESAAAVGRGTRTNAEGIRQLGVLLGAGVDLHIVPLPAPDHPDDVFHLMSMISPVDRDLAVIYPPLMPQAFAEWLAGHGITFLEVPDEEYAAMACNVLALARRDILMLDDLPRTRALLEAAGCNVRTYKGDEISRKGEGGPTCLTCPLLREAG